MKATENSFKQILSEENKLIIPFFQRKYVWEKDQWEQFFNDLFTSFQNQKEHFLGSIILKRSSGNNNFAKVIDGQQRLTTFSILVKAAYDELNEDKKKHFRNLLIADYTDNEPKIKHSKIDRVVYAKIIQEIATQEDIDEKKLQSGLNDCFNFFRLKIKIIPDILKFLIFITDKSKLFVKVNLEANEDEQKIFDSINSTGMPLTATDIIKNALFDRIIKVSDENTASDLYDKYWLNIFEQDDNVKFWDKVISTGRWKRSRSEIFLHAIALIFGIFDVDKHSLPDLSRIFKDHIANKNLDELKKILNEIAKYAKTYKEFPNISQDIIYKFDEFEIRYFHIANSFDITTFLPLVLFLKQNLNTNEYKKALYLIEITILCVMDTKFYNKLTAYLISDIKKNLNNCYEIIKEQIIKLYKNEFFNEKIDDWLNNISNNDAKVILFWIELFREYTQKDYKDKSGLEYSYTLEHLAPQKWQENWNDIFINDEDAEKYIYKIGNMTLLRGKFNSTLQNAKWQDKLNGNGKSKHFIKKYADLIINKELLEEQIWNKNQIDKRTSLFIEDFYKIWDISIFTEKGKSK